MKNRDVISDVVNDLKKVGVEGRISQRFVLSKLRVMNGTFLKRENDQLKLYHSTSIWTSVDNVKMIKSDINECTGINRSYNYMRSVERIPEMYSYSGGPLIKEIMAIDDGNIYFPSTLRDFKNIMKREFPPAKKYFWMRDGHLIIPDGPEMVNIEACFIDSISARKISDCYDEPCPEPLDEEFPCPMHLLGTVRQATLDELRKYYMNIVEDEVPDMDSNSKSGLQHKSKS